MTEITERHSFNGNPCKRLFIFPEGVHFPSGLSEAIAEIKGVRSIQECVDPENPECWAVLVEIEKGAEWGLVGRATSLAINRHCP